MSFQQGLSGLNATSKSLEVIGNNIANSATYGFKASRAEFADVYAAALNGAGTSNIGIGVNLAAVSQQFTQGNILSTENAMDLAINGAGFFQVTDGNSPVEFSRNGQFKIDRDGYIVNNELQKLLGYPASAAGVIQPGAAVRCNCRPRASTRRSRRRSTWSSTSTRAWQPPRRPCPRPSTTPTRPRTTTPRR
jgi:flagellar hook protein FlgE